MNTKKFLIALLIAIISIPTLASAQDQPPGLPAVDFGDEEVPEFETDQTQEPEEEEIGSPPSLEIDTGTPEPEPDPTPAPPEPEPEPQPDPTPAPVLPDTGPGALLSLIPALGYTITRKLNK